MPIIQSIYEILKILQDLDEDKTSFEEQGISYEERAFYDILIKVRDEHKFIFEEEKCLTLAKEIKKLVDIVNVKIKQKLKKWRNIQEKIYC